MEKKKLSGSQLMKAHGYTAVSIYLDAYTMKLVEEKAAARGQKRSAWIREAVTIAAHKYENVKKGV